MSNFIVSARKYRPTRFEDVVGQEHVSKTLKNALRSDHLAHAFLFCGPRGVGKTTCARILAKILNCQQRTPDFEACNTCSSCQSFNDNASFNIMELDAASNNSVDHIRALIEQVRFQPQQGKYKVFIIDEVHMLSTQAFNAFLKTLEEPPPYAIFILATTEKHKIIPTILSRCQIFDFRRIQVADMVQHLQDICRKEAIDAEEDALHIIAQKADGALRDALSIFDRIISFAGKKVTYEDVITNLNVLDYDYYFRVVDALLVENASEVLLIFDDILRKGFESDIFLNGLSEHLRNLLVCKDPQTLPLLEVSDTLSERYKKQASLSPSSVLLTALNLCNDCDIEYKMARNKRLHVEIALLKMAYIQRAVDLATRPVQEKQAEPEKKNPDLTAAPEKQPEPQPAPPAPTPPAAEPPAVEPPEPEKSTPALHLSLKPNSKIPVPQLKSLDALMKEVAAANKPQQAQDLNQQIVEQAWQAYLNEISSPVVKNILNRTLLSLKDDGVTVVATVGSQMARGALQYERELVSFLKQYLHRPDLIMEITVNPDLFPDEQPVRPPKPLTVKEKYNQMTTQNPLLEELRRRLDLKPDSDV